MQRTPLKKSKLFGYSRSSNNKLASKQPRPLPHQKLWAILKHAVAPRRSQTIDEMVHFLIEEWTDIPTTVINNLEVI